MGHTFMEMVTLRIGGRTHGARLGVAVIVAVLAGWHGATSAQAQLPVARLYGLFPPGARQGATVDLSLSSGENLDEAAQLLFSHPGIVAMQKTTDPAPYQQGPQPVSGQFQVSVAADVPPGVYEVRSVGRFGVSTARLFVVGDQPEVNETEPNNDVSQAQLLPLNTVVNGTADGEGADLFQFDAKAGQTLVIDCWAYRIESRMDATLMLLDASGKELARSRDEYGLDPRIVFQAPADGRYTVRLHDFIYQGSSEHYYRFSVCDSPHIEFAFPPAGLPGLTQSITLYGYNLPGGVAGDDPRAGATSLEHLTVEVPMPNRQDLAALLENGGTLESTAAWLDQFVYRLSGPNGTSNPARIGLATAPVVLETTEVNDLPDEAQILSPPCEAAGQFYPVGDKDWYAFEAKQGQSYWIDVISSRLGLDTDPELLIEGGGGKSEEAPNPNRRGRGRGRRRRAETQNQADGRQVFDDTQPELGGIPFRTASADPVVAWTAPKDGIHRLCVSNLFASGKEDPRRVYRLSIRQAQPDFQLVAALRQPTKDQNVNAPWSVLLRKGGSESLRVLALRRDGFDGPIQLNVEGLPEGVSCPQVTIGPGETLAYLPFTAAESAAPWSGEIKITGRAVIADQEVVRVARGGDLLSPVQQNQLPPPRPRVRQRVTLGVANETLAYTATAGTGQVIETSRNAKVQIPIQVTRRGEFKGNVVVRPEQLPRETELPEVTVNGDQPSGNMELTLKPNTPLGDLTLALQAETNVPYRHNPEAAARLDAEKLAAEKLAADAAAAVGPAEQSKQQAESALNEANSALEQAKQSLDAAAQAVQNASESDKAALQQSQEAAKKSVEEATQRVTQATQSRDAANQAAADAAARAKAAEEAKNNATQRAAEAAKTAEQKDVPVLLSAGAVTIRVAAAPLTLTPTAPTAALKPGQKLEVPVAIARLYGFADAVELEAALPDGAQGLSAEKLSLPADQAEGKIILAAAEQPAAGEFDIVIRARFKFNGQDMQVEQPLRIRVEAAPTQ